MRRVLGIAGWSGAGKTTLLVELVAQLRAAGLAVAVLKHDAHGLDGGEPRRDSERLHAAGAAVVALGPGEGLARWRAGDDALAAWVAELERRCDLVLLEGWKHARFPKLWLLRASEAAPPPEVPEVVAVLPWDGDRAAAARELAITRLDEAWRAAPVRAGVLVGGGSRRMGTPKQDLVVDGRSLLARAVAALAAAAPVTLLGGAGNGDRDGDDELLAQLPDVPGVRGPFAGVLAALRWSSQPWLIAACDLPRLSRTAVEWLLAQRAPGRWAVLPRVDGVVQPLLAAYEPQALPLLEAIAAGAAAGEGRAPAPSRLAGRPHVFTPEPPAALADAWRGVNTPAELAALLRGW